MSGSLMMPEAPPAESRIAREECKTVLTQIRDFVALGQPLGEFASALVRRDASTANGLASPAMRFENAIPDLMDWIELHIPPGLFMGESDLHAWSGHDGLMQAREDQRMWFYLLSNYWSPKRLARMKKPTSLHS